MRARILGPAAVLISLVGALGAGWLSPRLPGARAILAAHPEVSWAAVPIVFAVIQAVAVAVGEGLLPRTHGPIRTAQLRERNPGEYIAPWARVLGIVGTSLTFVTLIASVGIAWWMNGSMHEWFAVRLEASDLVQLGPLTLVGGVPGLPLTGPAFMGIVLVVCADALALRRVVDRGSVDADRQTDERIRRISSMRIVKSGLASLMGVEAAFVFLGGVTVVGVSHGGIPLWLGWLGVGGGCALALLAVGLLLTPGSVGDRRR